MIYYDFIEVMNKIWSLISLKIPDSLLLLYYIFITLYGNKTGNKHIMIYYDFIVIIIVNYSMM